MRTYKIGEADKIIVLFTQNHGKIRAVAKGSRKTTSKLGARLEPLNLANVMLWQGRNLATITGVDVIDNFTDIRESLEKIMMATTMMEIIDKLTLDDQENDALFQLLIKALMTLDKNFSPAILGAFCFRVLMVEGLTPQTDACCACGTAQELTAFNAAMGGALCRNCQSGQLISKQALDILGLIFNGRLGKALYLCSHAPELTHEIESLGINIIEYHLGQKLKSHLNLKTWG